MSDARRTWLMWIGLTGIVCLFGFAISGRHVECHCDLAWYTRGFGYAMLIAMIGACVELILISARGRA